jgi:proline dehydrogenase
MRILRSNAACKNSLASLQLLDLNVKRYTSTTSSSKGQAISMPTPLDLKPHETNQKKLDLSFEDSKTAFKAKSNLDLLRGYLVFQLCSIKFLVDNQKRILDMTRMVFGKRLFSMLMKSTFYGHFVAGQDQHDIRKNVENMMKYGVKSILDYSAEEDLNSPAKKNDEVKLLGGESKYFDPSETQSDKNKRIFLDCIDAVSGKYSLTNS